MSTEQVSITIDAAPSAGPKATQRKFFPRRDMKIIRAIPSISSSLSTTPDRSTATSARNSSQFTAATSPRYSIYSIEENEDKLRVVAEPSETLPEINESTSVAENDFEDLAEDVAEDVTKNVVSIPIIPIKSGLASPSFFRFKKTPNAMKAEQPVKEKAAKVKAAPKEFSKKALVAVVPLKQTGIYEEPRKNDAVIGVVPKGKAKKSKAIGVVPKGFGKLPHVRAF